MKKLFTIATFVTACLSTSAQTVTWSEDVACIVYTHCSRCHNNTNSLAAFPLVSYDDAYGNRYAIQGNALDRSMPPYLPNTDFQHYANEKNLTDQEIALINAWVEADAPEGNPGLSPPPPVFNPLTSTLTNPDFSERIPDFLVPPTGEEEFRCFVLGSPSAAERFISTIEVIPGNLSAVHHVLVFSDTSSLPVTLDAADPDEGYFNFSGIGSPSAKLLYGWKNGSEPYSPPQNMRLRLEPNARFVVQIVYAEDAGNKLDSTRLNVQYDTSATVRPVDVAAFLNGTTTLVNGPLFIPADSIRTFYQQYTVPAEITLLGIAPHAHHLCVSMTVYGVTPANDTLPLLKIDDWSMIWQEGPYPFSQPVRVPAGTVFHAEAVFDNTYMNDMNPNDPPLDVGAGTDEASETCMFYFSYLPYEAPDENIVVDSTPHVDHHLNCSPVHTVTGILSLKGLDRFELYPNPADHALNVIVDHANEAVWYVVTNPLGQIMMNGVATGQNGVIELDVSGLASGVYVLHLRDEDTRSAKRFVRL